MNTEQINELLLSISTPISKIENDLGIPSGVLNKAKNGTRNLPKKFIKPLQDYVNKNSSDVPSVSAPLLQGVISEGQPIKDRISTMKKAVTEKKVIFNENSKDKAEKDKALKACMDKINKDFGEGTVRLLGDNPLEKVDAISTGSISLNMALGVGGIPRGRITEIMGMESSGKTTITLHIIKEAQMMGLKCLFIDVEHAFDVDYAEAIGVDIDELVFVQPNSAEEALEVADRHVCSGAIQVVILDSVAALVPKSELEGEMGDSKIGLIARLMGQACRKMTGTIGLNKVAFIFINQLRIDINMKFGDPRVPAGGNALKFFSSVRLMVSKRDIKDGEERLGSKVAVKVIKNKVSPPFKVAEFDIMYGEGIDTLGEIVDLAVKFKIIEQGGAWFKYGDTMKCQGREKVYDFLLSHDIIREEIEEKILNFNHKQQ